MRILHTADWHIGQTLNGFGREAEHRAFLDDLGQIIEDHQVDALLVAGDVFDGRTPRARRSGCSMALWRISCAAAPA